MIVVVAAQYVYEWAIGICFFVFVTIVVGILEVIDFWNVFALFLRSSAIAISVFEVMIATSVVGVMIAIGVLEAFVTSTAILS